MKSLWSLAMKNYLVTRGFLSLFESLNNILYLCLQNKGQADSNPDTLLHDVLTLQVPQNVLRNIFLLFSNQENIRKFFSKQENLLSLEKFSRPFC